MPNQNEQPNYIQFHSPEIKVSAYTTGVNMSAFFKEIKSYIQTFDKISAQYATEDNDRIYGKFESVYRNLITIKIRTQFLMNLEAEGKLFDYIHVGDLSIFGIRMKNLLLNLEEKAESFDAHQLPNNYKDHIDQLKMINTQCRETYNNLYDLYNRDFKKATQFSVYFMQRPIIKIDSKEITTLEFDLKTRKVKPVVLSGNETMAPVEILIKVKHEERSGVINLQHLWERYQQSGFIEDYLTIKGSELAYHIAKPMDLFPNALWTKESDEVLKKMNPFDYNCFADDLYQTRAKHHALDKKNSELIYNVKGWKTQYLITTPLPENMSLKDGKTTLKTLVTFKVTS